METAIFDQKATMVSCKMSHQPKVDVHEVRENNGGGWFLRF